METVILPRGTRAEWLANRMQDVTASDVGAVCGVSPYSTPLRVYAEKKQLIPPIGENAAMLRGRIMEAAIIAYLRETYPDWKIVDADVYVRAPELRIGCTPDLMVERPDRPGIGTIQMKTVARRIYTAEWERDDGSIVVPLYYQLQALTEAKLTGADWAEIAVMVMGEFDCPVYLIDVPIVEEAWQQVVAWVTSFWRAFDGGYWPEVRPGDDYDTLKDIYPKEDEDADPLDLSNSNTIPALLDERAGLTAAIRDAEFRKKEIETEVMVAMGEASAASLPGWSIKWKLEQRAEQVRPASESRVLRINKRKQK